jgi:DNA-binding NtrC family response regulator
MRPTKSTTHTREKRSILIVEDEDPVANAITEGFRRSINYEFSVKRARNAEDYVRQQLHRERFDVYLIDLRLATDGLDPSGGLDLSGLKVLRAESYQQPGSLLIVYSAYAEAHQVVAAIHSGATDFVWKSTTPPHAVVTKIEGIFDGRRDAVRRRKELDLLIARKSAAWSKTYAGQTIVLVGNKVVAVGKTRLEAMMAYDERRQAHQNWPAEPEMLDLADAPREEQA